MLGVHIVTSTLLAVVTLGVTAVAHSAADDENLRTDLKRIAQQRIFFGHQSVGVNLIDGIEQLSTMAGVPVRIVAVKTASDVGTAMIGQTFIAENGQPLQKLKSFEDDMGSKQTGLDIALMKFCYVDFTAETDAKALFARYRTTIEGLKAKNPGTAFVHVTAPLTSEQAGPKEFLKRLLGRGGSVQNVRREEYNSLLRKTYQGREPIFDLARVESIAPDGTAVTVEWDGIVAPAMASEYTDDGGHLNSAGKLRAARELISVLAAIPVRPASHVPAR
ncbi:MAG TPA: hypothetical protein VMV48_07930 [Gallionellaceae bacterium]|nr:hypothetical protein [Gallionellaceae bacterium]